MGNHDAGRAMGLTAEALLKSRIPGQSALDLLDIVCGCYRGCDAEFEAVDPDRPGRVHPRFGDYTDPHTEASLGMLMLEAFAPGGVTSIGRYSPQGSPAGDAEAREAADLRCDLWYAEVYEPFRARYGFC